MLNSFPNFLRFQKMNLMNYLNFRDKIALVKNSINGV
jgi:hypothetical protein